MVGKIGFSSIFVEEKVYEPLYKTIVECSECGDKKEIVKIYKSSCKCGNLNIDICEPTTKCKFKYFQTISFKETEPIIYDILIVQEFP